MRRWADPLTGLVAAVLTAVMIFAGDAREGPVWANALAVAAYGAALAYRSRAPIPAAYGFAGLLLLFSLALTPPPEFVTIFFGLLLFPYTAGSGQRRALTLAYMPVLLGGIAAANLASGETATGDWIFPPAIALAAYVAGRNAVYRGALARELADATERAEAARTVAERRAVAAERRRIAREMHDVVAHSISVMVVQAGGARRILARDPARAEQAAAHIERTGRETLAEMRRLLGVMHGGEEPAELEPSPTLADLASLCARAGAKLTVAGDPRPIPQGLEMAVFRVVQEALADSSRTVPGAEPSVALDWSDDGLELRVSDDRPYASPEPPGARERAALYEGEVLTRARDGGDGHELVVRFPLDHEAVPLQGASPA